MLVQRRIQEEIHGNKSIQNGILHTSNEQLPAPDNHIKPKISNGRQPHSDEIIVSSLTNDQQKKSPTTNTSIDIISPSSSDDDDDDESTNEIVARNQSSKLDFHKTMTPMIGKENFELRKKLFEHNDESSFAGKNLSFFNLKYLLI
jgi:hypothetical protein